MAVIVKVVGHDCSRTCLKFGQACAIILPNPVGKISFQSLTVNAIAEGSFFSQPLQFPQGTTEGPNPMVDVS